MVDSGLCGLINRNFRDLWLSTDSIIVTVQPFAKLQKNLAEINTDGRRYQQKVKLRRGRFLLTY